MRKRLFHKFIILILLLPAVLLSGCWLANMPVYVPPHVPAQPIIEEPPVDMAELQPPAITSPAHGRFTIRYEPANTLNPILALNRDNISITSLIYESLFILNENLVASPLLCERWETIDNTTFTFTIYPDIPMHDGSMLTADDVAYSLRQARQRGRHRSKLRGISSISSDGDLTVTIVLENPNVRFTRLLDIPIIKDGSIDSELPPGTGPYILPNPDNLMIVRFPNHRGYSYLPLTTIYLKVASDSELTELFDQGSLSLLWDDPTSSFEIRINRDHEPRYYNTTSLQYLGFNAKSFVLSRVDVRRAIGCAVERTHIVDSIMNNPRPGQTVAAPVAISPVFNMYDAEWERRTIDPQVEMAALLERAGIDDYDQDGLLEVNDGVGGPGIDFTLSFLVNIENSHKVAAAEYIADSLRQVGFDIDVRVLPWNEFIRALQNDDFDMYYGEVQLGADFDLSPLLVPSDGSLRYGAVANPFYADIINAFLAAETPEEVSIAGKQLCDDIRINAPFIPILYKRHAIYSPIGVVTGARPSQSGVFHGFQNWTINLEMLN